MGKIQMVTASRANNTGVLINFFKNDIDNLFDQIYFCLSNNMWQNKALSTAIHLMSFALFYRAIIPNTAHESWGPQ